MTEPVVKLTVIGNPLSKGRPRFSRRTGHARTPRRTRLAENTIAWEAHAVMSGRQPYACSLAVTLRFFMATAGRVDVDNLTKLVLDALNGIVWADDSWTVLVTASKQIDRLNPRTEIEVRTVGALAA